MAERKNFGTTAGDITQIKHAMEAVKQGTVVLALRSENVAVLACFKVKFILFHGSICLYHIPHGKVCKEAAACFILELPLIA